MTNQINHAVRAAEILAWFDPQNRPAEAAQAHATLALVEQQRIANIISLASMRADVSHLGEQVAQDARNTLAEYRKHDTPDMGGWFELRPDIADALGIHPEEDR